MRRKTPIKPDTLPPQDQGGDELDDAPVRGAARRLMATILGYPALLAGGACLVATGAAAALAEPWLFGYAIDTAIVPRDRARLVQLSAALVFLIFIRMVSTVGQAYLFEALGQAVTRGLRDAVFSRLQRLPLAIFDRNPSGRLMTRVTNDNTALAEMFSGGFVLMLSNTLLLAGIIAALLLLDLRLALITLSIFPLMLAATARFSVELRKHYRRARSKLSALNAFLAENLTGMKVVHLFNRQQRHGARFARLNQAYSDAQVASIRTYAYLQPTITVAAGISIALLIWFGGNAAAAGSIRIGQLATFFLYTLALYRPLRDIADKWNVFLSGLAAAEKIYAVLDWAAELPEKADREEAVPYEIRGRIVFENVWFAYEAERWVLQDFSLEVAEGSRIGIAGPSGSGKTTLAGLLMRFYEPQKGRILLDGKDLREYDTRRLRASIGIVQQDVFLFSGSVEDNVTLFSGQEASGELQRAGLEPGKVLSERGGNLSAGERQLLAFQRALFKKPRLWILDEAASNLDSSGEIRMQRQLAESDARTVLLIAHRLAAMLACERILVMNKGRIVESGSHADLMRRDGLYARLYRYQQFTEAP